MKSIIKDHGGRRHPADRRRYTPKNYFPERRATRYRRSGWDRRQYSTASPIVARERRKIYFETTPVEQVA
jgi:hypothetical protein